MHTFSGTSCVLYTDTPGIMQESNMGLNGWMGELVGNLSYPSFADYQRGDLTLIQWNGNIDKRVVVSELTTTSGFSGEEIDLVQSQFAVRS